MSNSLLSSLKKATSSGDPIAHPPAIAMPSSQGRCASVAMQDTHAEARLADAGGEVRRPGDPGR